MRDEVVNNMAARRIEMVQGAAKSRRKMKSLANREFQDSEPTEAEILQACAIVDAYFRPDPNPEQAA